MRCYPEACQTMTTKKTIGTVVLTSGLASGALVAGLAFSASAAVAAPVASPPAAAAPASVTAVAARLAPDAALKPWPVLRQGTNSAWPKVTVRSLQYLLDSRGAKLAADGVFGAGTKTAVVAFQRTHHLTADGVVGAQTWRALLVTVKLGSTGYAVRAVQDQADFRVAKYGYSVAVDGAFGPTTQLFVRAFQLSAGLASDGVAGQLTWQALVTEAQ
jgi:peptidoglycan hydrolase-like protein with peptidoglycan-binding domain